MVEGGPTLAAAFIAADLVDEAILFHSAKVVGADGIDALDSAAAMTMLHADGSSRWQASPSAPTGKTSYQRRVKCNVYRYYQ